MTPKAFKDSQEAVFRKLVRDAIRKAPFTKGERDVTMALFNHWLHHKGGPKPVIHPGRRKLARSAGVSIRTVAATLAMLRAATVIDTVSHAKGGWGTSTRYSVNVMALFTLCGCDWVDQFLAGNCTHSGTIFAHKNRAKIAHGNTTLEPTFARKADHA